jgi:glycosyltransferase involved in cell wall biosynthesis
VSGTRRIAIDARYLSHGLVGGIHTYLSNLTLALQKYRDQLEFTFWIDDKAQFDLASSIPDANIERLGWRSPLSSIHNDLKIGARMARTGANLAHFPANYGFAPSGLPRLITIHDAINLLPWRDIISGHSKTPAVVAKMSYLQLASKRSLAGDPFVVTVSHYSRREILRNSRLPEHHVSVVHSAPAAHFRPAPPSETDELRRRLALKAFVVLADAIKNPATVLEAMETLPENLRQRTSLVFFARRQPDACVLDAAETGACQLLLQPDMSELVKLFSVANVFVFPSLYEGFGLPVLEAMACGTPVIASNVGSIPEVLGPAGVVAEPFNAPSFAASITRMLTDPGFLEHHRRQALARASEFSWERSASSMFDVYSDVLERSVHNDARVFV